MIAFWLAAASAAAGSASGACPLGLFQSPDGHERVVITAPQSDNFRYMYSDGRRGNVVAPDSPFKCSDGILADRSSPSRPWAPIALRLSQTKFESHRTSLSGTLIEAEGGPRPLVVMVHGSERTSPMTSAYPYIFASYGLSVFAYDKRGTGRSEGEYTQNFELLADDAAAALAAARRLAEGRYTRAGFFGGSQGGWVAPLAATRSPADYVAVGFGLIASPLEEDREQVLSEMRELGYGGADLAAAGEVADATGKLVESHFTSGFEQLAGVKRRHGSKPWFGKVKGEFTGAMLKESDADLRRVGRSLYDNLELIWDYDAPAVIRRLKVPQLWVLAEADREAPSDTSLTELKRLRAEGANLAIYSFPGTDHGMVEFTQAPDGSRTYTRITDGYFRMLADWIKGAPPSAYGRARQH